MGARHLIKSGWGGQVQVRTAWARWEPLRRRRLRQTREDLGRKSNGRLNESKCERLEPGWAGSGEKAVLALHLGTWRMLGEEREERGAEETFLSGLWGVA